MTGLWGQAIDAEVAYRHAEVRGAFPRRRTRRPRRGRPATARSPRAVAAAAGLAGAAAGIVTASGRR